MTPMQVRLLRAIHEAKMEAHPELRRPLSFPVLRRVLAREHVALVIEPYPRLAHLLPLLGTWTIVLDEDAPAIERLIGAAHELAHLWCHHDPHFDRAETNIYDKSGPTWDTRREEEADYFATLLMSGRVTPETQRSSWPRYQKTYEPRPLVRETRPNIYCSRCEVEIGQGPGKRTLAYGADFCIQCAFEDYPPLPDEIDGGW